jgi:RNA polymerase-binding transcription factor DksA
MFFGVDIFYSGHNMKKNITEVTIMNDLVEGLYLELRQSEQEIKESLRNRRSKDWLSSILVAELQDINFTIRKMEKGNFGQSEISGELLPKEILKTIPTIKSMNDLRNMDLYFRKPIH